MSYLCRASMCHTDVIKVGITHVIFVLCQINVMQHVSSQTCHSSRYLAVVKMCCKDVIETNCPCDLVCRQVNLLSRLVSSIGTGDLGIT